MKTLAPYLKRVADIVIAAAGLSVALPIMIIAGLAAIMESKGGPIYASKRLGKDGKVFTLYKLRTMVKGAEQIGAGLAIEKNDTRITRVGRILRATSLDELPQLYNVLRGDMSMIGPRPLPVEYFERWTPTQRRRLEAMPGITGWAQVNGRNELEWDRRLAMDVWYVDNWSLRLDAMIFLKTILCVLTRSGVSGREGEVAEFRGQ